MENFATSATPTPTEKNKLIVSSSPHIKSHVTTQKIMLTVLISLLPNLVMSVVWFGISALVLIATCIISCVLFESLFCVAVKKEQSIYDLSAVVTGLILAFNLPPKLPIYMAVFGCFIAIVVVKQLFGGIGQNFANPAVTARVVLLISFSAPMTTWLVPLTKNSSIEMVAGATPLAIASTGVGRLPTYFEMLIGMRGGSIGETCALALLFGGAFLIFTKVISPIIPTAFILTVYILSAFFGVDPLFAILAGGVLLGAIFMATDYVTTPITDKGKVIFGIGCGILTVLIRVFASFPEGTSFAILIMNLLTPHIDRLTMSKPFGGAK